MKINFDKMGTVRKPFLPQKIVVDRFENMSYNSALGNQCNGEG